MDNPKKKARIGGLLDLAKDSGIQFGQEHENDPATLCLLHHPDTSVFLANLHPAASLHQQGTDLATARSQLDQFRIALETNGVRCFTVREALTMGCPRDELVAFAAEALKYIPEYDDCTEDDLPENVKNSLHNMLSEDYKVNLLSTKSRSELVDIMLLQPSIHIKASARNTNVEIHHYAISPIGNLVFQRDSMITTRKGTVLCHLASSQRDPEPKIAKVVLKSLGVPVVAEVPRKEGYTLEGGDFFPMGKDLCMVGIGMRSTRNACEYLMEKDAFGTDRVAVVDTDDHDQDRMHLDTIFNVISYKAVVLLESVVLVPGHARYVDEYVKDPQTGKYSINPEKKRVRFEQYLTDEGYSIKLVTHQQQLEYCINFLNCGGAKIVSVNPETEGVVSEAAASVKYVPFDNMTNLYGAAHCVSQVLSRERVER